MNVIVDFGLGNLFSIQSKIERLKHPIVISSKPDDIACASKLILPGVGHFYEGMKNLRELGLVEILSDKVLVQKTPVLGICLGMQLFCSYSEEGECRGLSWINGESRLFDFSHDPVSFNVPHMGWNTISVKKESLLLSGIPENIRFYFAHSYYVETDADDIVATTDYGFEVVAVIDKGNIYGTQFHPEKSREFGLRIIDNFLKFAK